MPRHWTTRRPRESMPSFESLAARLASPPARANERHFHEDLLDLPDGELRLELHRLRLAVLLSDPPCEWDVERLDRIEAELRARHAR